MNVHAHAWRSGHQRKQNHLARRSASSPLSLSGSRPRAIPESFPLPRVGLHPFSSFLKGLQVFQEAPESEQRMVWHSVVRAVISDDNPAVQFGRYVVRIAHHVALDCGETKDWVLNRLAGAGSADEEAAGEPAAQEHAHVARVDENGPGSQEVAASTRKKILILMSDTGGGHRASANAIKAALHRLEPESGLEVKIVDVLEEHTLWFSNRLYSWYVTFPVVWETIYNTTKSTHGKPWPIDTSKFLEFTVRAGFRRCIAAEKPDLVLSVHPILQCIPLASFMPPNELYAAPRPIPFVTVVTDLGDAVCVFLYEFACTQIHD